MRLTCPNCGAQYEVPSDVIPPEGRDVQCSNCGSTWFEDSTGSAAASAPAGEPSAFEDFPAPDPTGAAAEAAPETAEAAEEGPETAPGAAPEQPPAAAAAPGEDPGEEDGEDPEAEAAHPPRERRKPRLAPALADILREEAAREAELRASGESGLESQSVLGLEPPELEEAERRARQSRNRMAVMRGENPAEIEAAETGSRRGLLPDIEEINSTLRASTDAETAAGPSAAGAQSRRRGGGFTPGFLLAAVAAAALAGVYAKAPEIAKAVPQADPAVSSYVALVDQARVWLDAQVRSVMENPPL